MEFKLPKSLNIEPKNNNNNNNNNFNNNNINSIMDEHLTNMDKKNTIILPLQQYKHDYSFVSQNISSDNSRDKHYDVSIDINNNKKKKKKIQKK